MSCCTQYDSMSCIMFAFCNVMPYVLLCIISFFSIYYHVVHNVILCLVSYCALVVLCEVLHCVILYTVSCCAICSGVPSVVSFVEDVHFVGVFDVGEYVYFFIREHAVEEVMTKTRIYSRVVRVCKVRDVTSFTQQPRQNQRPLIVWSL